MLTPTEEFPGIPTTSPSNASASKSSVTTLANGLTVVSETASSTSTITLTYPNAGATSESPSEAGAALANKYLNFKSGSGLSAAIILRNLENSGATPFSSVDKFGATVGFTAAKDEAARLVPLLATTCDFAKWDVKEAKTLAKEESDAAAVSVQTAISDAIFSASYGPQSSLGSSVYGSTASSPAVQSFRERGYALNGAILAATGIDDHEAFVSAVTESLAESHVGNAPVSAAPSTFIGGETRIYAPSAGMAHVVLGFQGPANASPLLAVVEQCIELAAAESSNVSGYTSSKAGLVGVYASASAADGSAVTDQLCSIMTTVPSADIISRAISLAKANALFSIDGNDSASLAKEMTESVLESGSFSYADVADKFDAVSVDQVQAAFSAMGGSTPSMAAVGDISSIPYHGSIVTRFSS